MAFGWPDFSLADLAEVLLDPCLRYDGTACTSERGGKGTDRAGEGLPAVHAADQKESCFHVHMNTYRKDAFNLSGLHERQH